MQSESPYAQLFFAAKLHINLRLRGLPVTQPRNKIDNMHDVVVYSRTRCHLCEVVKNTLRSLEHLATFEWREVDIDQDPELRALYSDSVPVVFIDGRKSFKYRMAERDFLRRLEG